MSGSSTKRMIERYFAEAMPTMFLSGFFRSPPENFHNSETVELDVVRGSEKVAVVVQDLSAGYRMNEANIYTNKEFTPPILKEAFPIKAVDLILRDAGNNPFQDVNFQASVTLRAFTGFRLIEGMIRRNLELQASQVLQTGTLSLVDSNGTALYALDYKPKATHFPTSVITWGQANATVLEDIDSLARVIRADGLTRPDRLIFGRKAWTEFVKDATVQAIYNNRRIDQGAIVRMERNGEGGTYHGTIEIGAYSYELWTYDGLYEHPQTGVKTDFVAPGSVIILSVGTRLDATFGAIPRIVPPDGRLLPFMPGRMSGPGQRMDLFTNVWVSADGEQLFGGLGTRQLCIPTAIDTYGCLNTGLT